MKPRRRPRRMRTLTPDSSRSTEARRLSLQRRQQRNLKTRHQARTA